MAPDERQAATLSDPTTSAAVWSLPAMPVPIYAKGKDRRAWRIDGEVWRIDQSATINRIVTANWGRLRVPVVIRGVEQSVLSERALYLLRHFAATRSYRCAPSTIVGMIYPLQRFILWLADNPGYRPEDKPFEWSDLTMRTVMAWYADELEGKRKGQAVAILRQFYRYGCDPEAPLPDFDERIIAAWELESLEQPPVGRRVQSRDPEDGPLDRDELDAIQRALEYGTRADPRDRVITWLCIETAGRTVELCDLRNRDLIVQPIYTSLDPGAPVRLSYHLAKSNAKRRQAGREVRTRSIDSRLGELLVSLQVTEDAPPLIIGKKRAQVVELLRPGGKTLRDLLEVMEVTEMAVRQYLWALERAGLVQKRAVEMQRKTANRGATWRYVYELTAEGETARTEAGLTGRPVQVQRGGPDARLCWWLGAEYADAVNQALKRFVQAENIRTSRIPLPQPDEAGNTCALLPIFVYRFRHGVANDRLAHGASLDTVRDLLGHSSRVVTLRNYTRNSPRNAVVMQQATDWAVAPLVKRMQGVLEDPAQPVDAPEIPSHLPVHLQPRGHPLKVIGPIGKCGLGKHCPRNPVTSCFTCPDFIARVDNLEVIRELRSDFIAYLERGDGASTSSTVQQQLRDTIVGMSEWIDHIEAAKQAAAEESEQG